MFELLLTNLKSSPVREVEFLGEVGVTGFINGQELATAIGLTEGIAQHTAEPWLHFVLDDVVLYVAKKPYRCNLSWNHINAVGAVFGDKTVEINGKTYKVRLLKSSPDTGNIYTGSSDYDPVGTYESEWNRLMYPIHSTVHVDKGNPSSVSGEGIRLGTLAQYSDSDLITDYRVGNGAQSWCQETPSSRPTDRVTRGTYGVSSLVWVAASLVHRYYGWRPVLELVG